MHHIKKNFYFSLVTFFKYQKIILELGKMSFFLSFFRSLTTIRLFSKYRYCFWRNKKSFIAIPNSKRVYFTIYIEKNIQNILLQLTAIVLIHLFYRKHDKKRSSKQVFSNIFRKSNLTNNNDICRTVISWQYQFQGQKKFNFSIRKVFFDFHSRLKTSK